LKIEKQSMKETPIPAEIVREKIAECGIQNVGTASIREIVRLINLVENATGEKFIRMEMGVPGLPPCPIGTKAEIEALERGVASIYPPIEGISGLKEETARFAKLFLNIDIKPAHCVPTTGSMQGSMAAFLVGNRVHEQKDTTLFIDPGFPVQKQQIKVIGQRLESFDMADFRGAGLRSKLESYLENGNISTILYSNPNNPTWMCLTEEELQIIGELATKYDTIVIEDLAYFAMDFRQDLSIPGVPPYQPTVARYTNNYVLLVSGSKSFSYAGQRLGLMLISDTLFDREFPALKRNFSTSGFGHSVIYGALYALSAGTGHSTQHAFAAILHEVNEGRYNFVEDVKEYGERAKRMKSLFIQHGFKVVYDKDVDQEVGDGFYFTISYPGFTGSQLIEELLYYGISAVSLDITGGTREGLRACVSLVSRSQLQELGYRLSVFQDHHPC
jgi:aspartate/methionine/tyrosine aminotransferase